nr:MAG TPA: hypothetical protein [Podoviridae sp. ctgHy19]
MFSKLVLPIRGRKIIFSCRILTISYKTSTLHL